MALLKPHDATISTRDNLIRNKIPWLMVPPLKYNLFPNKVIATGSSFTYGDNICFDGNNMWMIAGTKLLKFNISDGTYVSFTVTGGYAIAFDGTFLWVGSPGHYSKVSITDGTETYYSGGTTDFDSGFGMTFDGTSIWMGSGASGGHAKFAKVNISDGSCTVYSLLTNEKGASNMCFDGHYIWASCWGNSCIYKLDPDDGSYAKYSGFTAAAGICFDGSDIWVGSRNAALLWKVNRSDGTSTPYVFDRGNGICYDGKHIWMGARGDPYLVKFNPVDGTYTTVTVAAADVGYYYGLAFDGSNIWANGSDGNVYRTCETW